MNRDQILDLFNGVRDTYVLAAIQSQEGRPRKVKIPGKRLLLIAAAIGLSMVLVGCGVVYLLRMQDFKLGDQEVATERWDFEAEAMVPETIQQQVLTLGGIQGTPNYQAAKEWYEFQQTFDPAGKPRLSVEEIPQAYECYFAHYQEMLDKLDEITQRYDLKLLGPWARRPSMDTPSMLPYLGIDSLLLPDAPAEIGGEVSSASESGYFFSQFGIQMTEGENIWPDEAFFVYYYTPKGYFNPAIIELEDTGDWQEQNYTTPSGARLLILRSPSDPYTWIFCDREDATIYLRMETIQEAYSDASGKVEVFKTPMTDAQMKQILDTIDFSLTPRPGTN